MDKKIHTEPEDDIAVVCGLNSLLFIFLTNIRIPQPMSRPFTAMTGNRKYYLCLYEKKTPSHTISGKPLRSAPRCIGG